MADTEWQPKYVGGLAVYRRERPGARRVVLVHGSMDRAGSFIKATRRLPDLAVVRYDRRGYGRSAEAGLCASIDEQVADLVTVLDGVPSSVVGHSLGGMIALAAAQRHPDLIVSVAAFESPMPWTRWWPKQSAGGRAVQVSETDGVDAAGERFMRAMIGDERWQALPEGTRVARRAESGALLADLRAAREEVPPFALEALAVPVLAGHSTESEVHHQQAARVLAAGVDAAELIVIEGAGHGAHHSHPREFAAFIQRTVDRGRR